MSEQGREDLERVEYIIEKAQQGSVMREEWGAQRMCVEHATYRMEWKSTVWGDDEGNKCLPLVSRSRGSIYLCFPFGALFYWVISVP